MKSFTRMFYCSLFLVTICASVYSNPLPLNKLKLPPGFSISIYALVPNARSMTLGENGIVFVGTRSEGDVYAVVPDKNFTRAKKVVTIAHLVWICQTVSLIEPVTFMWLK